MAGPAFAAAVLLAAVLIFSAATKIAHPYRATEALVALGLATKVARRAVFASIGWELGSAAAIALWPAATATQATSIALFASFAVVALVARTQVRAIDCGCFGALRHTRLGWIQIAEAVVATLAVLLIGKYAASGDLYRGAAIFALAGVSVTAMLLVLLFRAWLPVRRERRSLGSVVAHLSSFSAEGSPSNTGVR